MIDSVQWLYGIPHTCPHFQQTLDPCLYEVCDHTISSTNPKPPPAAGSRGQIVI